MYNQRFQRFLIPVLIFCAGFTFGLIFIVYSSRTVPYFTKNIELDLPSQLAHNSYSLTAQLNKEVRVLCWIMTNPGNHENKAKHVRDTWGKRCNILLFMTTADDPSLGNTVNLPVDEGYDNLWNKTKEAFKYVYANHFEDADWFLKVDDDTYVFMENLRYFLYPYSPSDPIYFGYKYRIPQAYMSGGAGYVLSKEALRRFVEEALPDGEKCKLEPTGAEDVEIGICLENVNVIAGDSRDRLKGRFFPFRMDYHLRPAPIDEDFWYYINSYYPVNDGPECCSEFAITFHYVEPNYMYVIEYLVYQMQAVGLEKRAIALPVKKTFDEVLAELEPYIARPRSSTTTSTTGLTTDGVMVGIE